MIVISCQASMLRWTCFLSLYEALEMDKLTGFLPQLPVSVRSPQEIVKLTGFTTIVCLCGIPGYCQNSRV